MKQELLIQHYLKNDKFKFLQLRIRFISTLLILLTFIHCHRQFRTYINARENPPKVYIEPTLVDIDIYFLRSISSQTVTNENKDVLIQKITKNHAEWFDIRLKRVLLSYGIPVVSKDKADIILEPKILDMGEVRPKVFIQGLSVGLVFGLIVGEATGKPDIGLAVFVWEVIEEIIIVYLLKSYFMITTIGLTVKDANGLAITSKEFTSYSNDEFEENLPEFTKFLRENKVRGSLEKNARDIAEFIMK